MLLLLRVVVNSVGRRPHMSRRRRWRRPMVSSVLLRQRRAMVSDVMMRWLRRPRMMLRNSGERTARFGRIGDSTDRRLLQLLLLLLLFLLLLLMFFLDFFHAASFLDEVVDGLLRLFILLQILRVDSNFREHFQENRIFAQILHIHRLKTFVFVPADVSDVLEV